MNILEEPIKDITHLIPQKQPFVMVDELIEFSQTHVKSGLTININNIFVANKVLSEPGIIENMAQTVALHTGYDFFLKNQEAPTGYIGAIKKVMLHQLPNVGETINTQVEILQEFMGVTMVAIKVFNMNKILIASGEMKTVIAGNE